MDKELYNETLGKIRKTLIKFDFEIAYAKGQIEYFKSIIDNFQNSNKKCDKIKVIYARVDYERFEKYLDQLISAKNDLIKSIQDLLDTYNFKYSQIWVGYFIRKQTIEEISEISNYSSKQIWRVLKSINKEIENVYKQGEEDEV